MFLTVDFGQTSATVGYTLKNAAGGDAQARTTTGVTDLGNGAYGVEVTLPATAVATKWDTGGGSPIYAHEDLIDERNYEELHDIEGGEHHSWLMRVMLSALSGKLSGAATLNVKIRDLADAKDRIDATVDASGNRTVVTLDGD